MPCAFTKWGSVDILITISVDVLRVCVQAKKVCMWDSIYGETVLQQNIMTCGLNHCFL